MGELIRTGGTFAGRDAAIAVGEWPRYFLAGATGDIAALVRPSGGMLYRDVLIAMNELADSGVSIMSNAMDAGANVLIDSGVYKLSIEHAKAHDIPYYVALTVKPEDVDGFDDLFQRYVSVVKAYGDQSWGYVEFDQGGRESKIAIRAKLEALGLRPIPVYHPLSDGWDYFDELASKYDRICIGNVVMASPSERRRLVATAWQRKRKYPHLWIHLLGYTPNEFLNAYPVDSGDSSTWLLMIRWSNSHRESSMQKTTTGLPLHFRYRLGEPGASLKTLHMSAYTRAHNIKSWQNHLRTCASLGFDLLPTVA